MDFGARFGIVFVFLLFVDGLFISSNKKLIYGLYNKKTIEPSLIWTLPCAFLCWILTSLYVAGHTYESGFDGWVEGIWLGSLVYGVFNLTSCVTAPDWRDSPSDANLFQKTVPIWDTVWGTFLFGAAAWVSAMIQ